MGCVLGKKLKILTKRKDVAGILVDIRTGDFGRLSKVIDANIKHRMGFAER